MTVRWRPAAASAVIIIAAVLLRLQFPAPDGYYAGADEGTYYRQATAVREHGLGGYRVNAERYLADRGAQVFPPPLRLVSTALNAAALAVRDSYRSLSYVSLACFVALCALGYVAVSRIWGPDHALAAAVLLASSPLGGAMARRALTDSLGALAGGAALFAFLLYVVEPGTQRLVAFSASLACFCLARETALLYLPFFLIALLALRRSCAVPASAPQAVLACAVPAAVALLTYAAAFGTGTTVRIFETMLDVNVRNPAPYVVQFCRGPWYRYLVDLMLLAPATTLLAVLYAGYVLLGGGRDRATGVLLGLSGYTLLVFPLLTMNVRYVMPLDLAVRLLAAGAVLHVASRFGAGKWAATALLAALVASDVRSFYRHFAVHETYDPVSFNLLAVEGFIPSPRKSASPPTDPAGGGVPAVPKEPTAAEHLALSLEHYRAGRYEQSIEAARSALRLKSDYAAAWNNMCAAFNQLGRWDEAIEAGRAAVRLDPADRLARNNLAWAEAKKREAIAGTGDRGGAAAGRQGP